MKIDKITHLNTAALHIRGAVKHLKKSELEFQITSDSGIDVFKAFALDKQALYHHLTLKGEQVLQAEDYDLFWTLRSEELIALTKAWAEENHWSHFLADDAFLQISSSERNAINERIAAAKAAERAKRLIYSGQDAEEIQ